MVRMIIIRITAEAKISTKTKPMASEVEEAEIEAEEVEVDMTVVAVEDTIAEVEVAVGLKTVETEVAASEAKDNEAVDSEADNELILVKEILKSKKLNTIPHKFTSNLNLPNLLKNGNHKNPLLHLQSLKIVQQLLKTEQSKTKKKENQDKEIKTKTTMPMPTPIPMMLKENQRR